MGDVTSEEKGPPLWLIGAGSVGGLCLLALLLFFAFRVPQGIVVARGNSCVKASAGAFEVTNGCTEAVELKRRNDLISPTPGTKLDEVDGGVRLQHGKATFAVWKRQGSDAMQVRVSHGSIEVVGTRFTVEQTETDGNVKLDEGEIAFHWLDGHVTRLAAGESLSWGAKAFAEPKTAPAVLAPAPTTDAVVEAPVAPTPAPTEAPPPAAPATVVPPESVKLAAGAPPEPVKPDPVASPEAAQAKPAKLSMDGVLDELATLRNQRKYKEAVTLLRPNCERSDLTMSQRARLSYEMGLLLQDRLRDKDAACRHWRWHAERFPENGERAQRVNSAIQACDSGASAPTQAAEPAPESPTPQPEPGSSPAPEEHD